MSWWAGRPPIETQIEQATSEAIPSGEQDLALNLEISDGVRSKAFGASETVAALKRRLYNQNPNVQILTLHLMDALVKNGGLHFVKELATKGFIDSYAAEMVTLRNQSRSPEVIDLMLEYLQSWALAMKNIEGLGYVNQKYQDLRKSGGFDFPEPGPPISESFLDSATAPEWVDSDTCMKSGQPFSFYNRKHHCRNCGGVFLQEYCSNFVPLPHFGINEPVRVCVDCKENLEKKTPKPKLSTQAPKRQLASNNADLSSRYDRELKEAIEQSLKSQQAPQQPVNKEEELDDEMKRAIDASLADMRLAQPSTGGRPPTIQKRPLPTSLPEDGFKDCIESFSREVSTATPRDAAYNQHLISLNQRGTQLQPQLISELKSVTGKLQTLEDLNGRLAAASGYYDQFLEAALSPEQHQPQQLEPVNDVQRGPPVAHSQEYEDDVDADFRYIPRYAVATHGQQNAPMPSNEELEESIPPSTGPSVPVYNGDEGDSGANPWENDPSHQSPAQEETYEQTSEVKSEHDPEEEAKPDAGQEPVLIEL